MARTLPSDTTHHQHQHHHPHLLFLSLFAITATVAALCTSTSRSHKSTTRRHKRHQPPPPPLPPSIPSPDEPTTQPQEPLTPPSTSPPPPPPTKTDEELMKRNHPRRKLSVSLSLKLSNGLAKIRTTAGRRSATEEDEESIWMKKIILGERCRVPGDDGGDNDGGDNGEDDDLFIYDEKGNRRMAYHPRTPRSLPVSRTNSFIVVSDHNVCHS